MEAVQHRHNETGAIYTEISIMCLLSLTISVIIPSPLLFFFSAVMPERGIKVVGYSSVTTHPCKKKEPQEQPRRLFTCSYLPESAQGQTWSVERCRQLLVTLVEMTCLFLA